MPTATTAPASACVPTPTSPACAWSTPASSPMPTRITTRGLRRRLGARPVQGAGRIHDAPTSAAASHDDFDCDGWYVSGVWNITGENLGLQGRRHRHAAAERSGQGHVAAGPALRHGRPERRHFTAPSPSRRARRQGRATWTVGVNWYWRSQLQAGPELREGQQRTLQRASRLFVRTTRASSSSAPSSTGN